LQPYEGSLEDVDQHRIAIGLEPVDEYLKKVRELFKSKKTK
jgi:hypothetical protein